MTDLQGGLEDGLVSIAMEYEGELHCRAVHGPSGTVISTDAPKDNQGRGESFSPTDLVATALGTCILTTMAIFARTLGVEFAGASATVEKEMTSAGLRRIERLRTVVRVPGEYSEEVRGKFERAAHACPVHKSMHPEVQMPIEFFWG